MTPWSMQSFMLNKYTSSVKQIQLKWLGWWYGVVFQHNNTHTHTVNLTKNSIQELGWQFLHPQYSHDLAPSNYHLFGHCQMFHSSTTWSWKHDLINSPSQDLVICAIKALTSKWNVSKEAWTMEENILLTDLLKSLMNNRIKIN